MSNEKEKILDRNGFEFEAFKFENEYSAKNLLLAMQEYADQQTSDLQKRIKELEDEVKRLHFIVDNGLGPKDLGNDI